MLRNFRILILTLGSVLALVGLQIWSSPVSAQPGPQIWSNGQQALLHVSVGEIIQITGEGFSTPTTGIRSINIFPGLTCQGGPISYGNVDSNDAGTVDFDVTAEASFQPEFSLFLHDTFGDSNCLTFTFAPPPSTPPAGVPLLRYQDSTNPVTLTANSTDLVRFTGDGLTADSAVRINSYQGADTCGLTGPGTIDLTADASGHVTFGFVFSTPGAYNYEIVDLTTNQVSNCLEITVNPAPAILANGSSGPLDVEAFDTVNITGTGFDIVPGALNEGRIHYGAGCTGQVFQYFPAFSDIGGTISEHIQVSDALVPQFSVQVTASNCIDFNVPDPTPPAILVNGSAGPVDVMTGDDLLITGTGFPHNAEIGIQFLLFSGGSCPLNTLVLDTFASTTDDQGGLSFTTALQPYALDNVYVTAFTALSGSTGCVQLNVIAPTPTATPTETVAPTSTDTPPTATDVPPTQIPTGSAAITIVTSTGDPIPDDTTVCIGDTCQNLDEIAGTSSQAAFVYAAAPSGTTVTFSDLEIGTHPLTVSTAGEVILSDEIAIVAGEPATFEFTYQLQPQSSPVVPTATAPPPAPTSAPVVSLPSTGTGAGPSSGVAMTLTLGLLLLVAACAVARRHMRPHQR